MDNDEPCIEAMRSSHPTLQWDVEDATAMSYQRDSFDAVLDKSLLDFLIYTQRKPEATYGMLAESGRVCRPGGVCLFLSWCPPKEMQVHMAGCPWRVETVQLEAPCDSSGRVPRNASVAVVGRGQGFVWAENKRCSHHTEGPEEALWTDFYLYVCTCGGTVGGSGEGEGGAKAEAGDFSGAVAVFLGEISSHPGNSRLYESVAQCYLMSESPEEVALALNYAIKATLLAPEWGDGHLTLARTHLAVSNFSLAVDAFGKAVEWDPSLQEEAAEDLEIATRHRDARAARETTGVCPPCEGH